MVDQSFFLCVAIETRDCAQAAGRRGPRLALRLEIPGEAFDVHAARREQGEVVFGTPVHRRSSA
jgi:hypothetical protein